MSEANADRPSASESDGDGARGRRSGCVVVATSWCGIAVVLTLAGVGCGGSASRVPSGAAPPSTSTAAPAASVAPLKISSDGCSLIPAIATGFAVEGGWVVTVAHATRGAQAITVDGAPADLVAIDLRSDVAVLRPSTAPRSPGSALVTGVIGDRVAVTVRRDAGPVTLRGEVQRTPEINFEEPLDHTYYKRGGLILTGIDIVHGDSGTAVNGSAGVIGMMFAMSREKGFAYAVDSDEISTLIPDTPGAPVVDSGTC